MKHITPYDNFESIFENLDLDLTKEYRISELAELIREDVWTDQKHTNDKFNKIEEEFKDSSRGASVQKGLYMIEDDFFLISFKINVYVLEDDPSEIFKNAAHYEKWCVSDEDAVKVIEDIKSKLSNRYQLVSDDKIVFSGGKNDEQNYGFREAQLKFYIKEYSWIAAAISAYKKQYKGKLASKRLGL